MQKITSTHKKIGLSDQINESKLLIFKELKKIKQIVEAKIQSNNTGEFGLVKNDVTSFNNWLKEESNEFEVFAKTFALNCSENVSNSSELSFSNDSKRDVQEKYVGTGFHELKCQFDEIKSEEGTTKKGLDLARILIDTLDKEMEYEDDMEMYQIPLIELKDKVIKWIEQCEEVLNLTQSFLKSEVEGVGSTQFHHFTSSIDVIEKLLNSAGCTEQVQWCLDNAQKLKNFIDNHTTEERLQSRIAEVVQNAENIQNNFERRKVIKIWLQDMDLESDKFLIRGTSETKCFTFIYPQSYQDLNEYDINHWKIEVNWETPLPTNMMHEENCFIPIYSESSDICGNFKICKVDKNNNVFWAKGENIKLILEQGDVMGLSDITFEEQPEKK